MKTLAHPRLWSSSRAFKRATNPITENSTPCIATTTLVNRQEFIMKLEPSSLNIIRLFHSCADFIYVGNRQEISDTKKPTGKRERLGGWQTGCHQVSDNQFIGIVYWSLENFNLSLWNFCWWKKYMDLQIQIFSDKNYINLSSF